MNHPSSSNKSSSLLKAGFSKAALLTLFVPLLTATCAMGAVITWDAAPSTVDLNTPSQVFTNGVFVLAGTANPVDTTVNGVLFKTFGTDSNFVPGGSNSDGGFAATNAYGNLLKWGSFLNSAQTPTTYSVISGLTNGQQYEIEVWMPIWNSDWITQLGDSTNGSNFGNANASPTLHDGNLFATPPAQPLSQYIFGTFTAVGTTQDLYQFAQTNYAGIASFELRDVTPVPEPQTWALAALGASAVLFRLRRTRRTV